MIVVNIDSRLKGLHMSLISLQALIEKNVDFEIIRYLKGVQKYLINQKMLSLGCFHLWDLVI